jgi:cell division protein FtsI (penicillin-binding protein 3)
VAIINVKDEVLIRIYVVLLVVVAIAVAVFAKAVRIVTVEGARWRELGDKSYVKYVDVPGERGSILAEDESVLATSLPFFDLFMDCASPSINEEEFKQSLDSLSVCFATYIDPQYTAGAWKEFLKEHRYTHKTRYLPLKKDATFEQVEFIKQFPVFRKGRNKGGLIVKRNSKRQHPFKMMAQRTIGYVREGANPIGIEGSFNRTLRDSVGKKLMQKVGPDVWIPVNDLAEIEPKSGDDVITTIDVNIQDVAQQALLRALEHHQAEHGTAVVMEVKTGKIKAIANIGKTETGWWEDYNYAIAAATEPGSTFKLASIMALLEDGGLRMTDSVDIENGQHQYFDRIMEDHEKTPATKLTVQNAFAASSNVGISKLVFNKYSQKPELYYRHLKDFGLSQPTGIEIEGESAPKIKDPKEGGWSGVTLPWMSIGYELQITPLQLLTFYNAVANNGKMMKPYLVSETQRFGHTVSAFKPTILRESIAKSATIDQAKKLLESVVDFGTAAHLKTDKYRFAGKTGTAQLNYGGANNAVGGYQASFAGYFPAENPVFSCIVVISKPTQNGFYGGQVAGPVFREIADRIASTNVQLSEPVNKKGKPILGERQLPDDVGLKNDMETVLKQLNIKHLSNSKKDDYWMALRPKSDTLQLLARQGMRKDLVPNVVGMGLKDALFNLENRGIRVVFVGYGKVASQMPAAGTNAAGQTVTIKLE